MELNMILYGLVHELEGKSYRHFLPAFGALYSAALSDQRLARNPAKHFFKCFLVFCNFYSVACSLPHSDCPTVF